MMSLKFRASVMFDFLEARAHVVLHLDHHPFVGPEMLVERPFPWTTYQSYLANEQVPVESHGAHLEHEDAHTLLQTDETLAYDGIDPRFLLIESVGYTSMDSAEERMQKTHAMECWVEDATVADNAESFPQSVHECTLALIVLGISDLYVGAA